MNDRRPTSINRKIIIGALIAAVGVALAGVILIPVLQQAQEIQEASQAEEIQEVQQVQKAQGAPQAEEIREVRQVQEVQQGQEVQLVDIIPSPRIIRLDQAGVSQRLSVQGYYSDGSVKELEYDSGNPFSYTPSDSTVVQIDSYGVVTGLKAGGADVVIGYGRFTATVPVLVWGPVRRIPPIDPNRLLEVSDDGSSIVLNRVMAKLEPGYGTTDAGHVASRIRGEIIFEYRTFPGYVIEFDANTEDDLEDALVVLKADPRVSHVYPDIGMVAASPWGSREEPQIEIVASDCYRTIETLCFFVS